MTYADRADLATHQGFRERVKVAMLVTAFNVSSEASTGDARTDSLRGNLATNILNDPEGYTDRFAWGIITNPTVAASGLSAPDGDLEFVVTTLWDAMAGV